MTSQVNAELSGRRYVKVLVHGNFQALGYRQLAERTVCEQLVLASEVACVKSSDVFFPGQQFSPDQIATRLRELQVDAVLTLQAANSGLSSVYVPQTTVSSGSATVTGNTIAGTATTQTFGGYNVTKPWAQYEAVFWAIADAKVAWYATAQADGSAYSRWDDLIKAAAKKTVGKLVSDGVVPKVGIPTP
jgi:hypothetical protein